MHRTNNTTIGLDIAKNVFHYAELNRNGRVTGSGMLKRNKVLSHFAGLEPTKVVMEACAGSHYWGRQLQECGHEVTLLPAHKVVPYVQGNKNDKNDAIAIAEAAGRPGIRAVCGEDCGTAEFDDDTWSASARRCDSAHRSAMHCVRICRNAD